MPQLAGLLEDPPSCSPRRRGAEMDDGGRKCVRAELISVNVVSDAICRIVVTTVSTFNLQISINRVNFMGC